MKMDPVTKCTKKDWEIPVVLTSILKFLETVFIKREVQKF